MRLTKKACQVLDIAYKLGWRGHYEVSVPTILFNKNCKIEDIGISGEFVKPGNEKCFYTNTPENDGLTPGTFVYKPCCIDQILPNKLYHPIK